jgi:hypothetical protein
MALQEELGNTYARIFQAVGAPFLTREEGRVASGYPAKWEGELWNPLNMIPSGSENTPALNEKPKAVYPTKKK